MNRKYSLVSKEDDKLAAKDGDFDRTQMLQLYMTLRPPQRRHRFVDTARAARMTGLARRTIQFWIEIGAIHAILIGRRYQIDVHSVTEYLEQRLDQGL